MDGLSGRTLVMHCSSGRATFCGSGPVPTIEVDLATLSSTNARSSEWGLCLPVEFVEIYPC